VRAAPEVVTLHLWGVRGRAVPWALTRMATHRRPLRATPGLIFGRLLGTGHGRTFTPTDADPRHWALIASWETNADADAFEAGPLARAWHAHTFERWRIRLRPLSSTGRWAGHEPFGPTDPAARPTGPCAVLTRARLVPRQLAAFWRAVPPVAQALPTAEGLRFARGIGEAPIGLQATFSLWDDLVAANEFAYGNAAHRRVIERTTREGWYSEQLFARFAVIDASGHVNGREPLAMRSNGGSRLG
jgi:hypothetical protein